MTPPPAPRAGASDARELTEITARPRPAAIPEGYLTMSGLRERGWTDAMIRDYLGDPDATRPNPRYWSAAPMKLYLADRAEAAEATPEWAARKALGDKRRAAGEAVFARKRAETGGATGPRLDGHAGAG